MAATSRVALYARVSTTDQHPENQTLELNRYAAARGWTVIAECIDKGISGAKERRPGLDTVMSLARKRKVDIVLVARFDRFARSVRHLITALEEFRALGVDFVSLAESVDTSTPAGKMMFTVIAGVSEFERALIRERIMSGLARAKAQGKLLGRPRKAVDAAQVAAMRRDGQSLRQIGRALGISKDAVATMLSVMGAESGGWAPSEPTGEKQQSA